MSGSVAARVAIISPLPTIAERLGGNAYYAKSLAGKLAKSGYRTEVWTKRNYVATNIESPGNFEVVRAWRPGLCAAFDLLRLASRRRPDTVHFQHAAFVLGSGIAGEIAALILTIGLRVLGINTIVTCHDTPSLEQVNSSYVKLHSLPAHPLIVKIGLFILFNAFALCAETIVVHQPAFALSLASEYRIAANRIKVVPHLPIEFIAHEKRVVRQHHRIRQDAKVLLFFGFASKYKGIEHLLDAMDILTSSADSPILILGAGPHPKKMDDEYQQYYADMMQRAKSTPNVICKGFVEDSELDELICAADLAIFPYIECQGMSGPVNQCVSLNLPFLVSSAVASVISGLHACVVPVTGEAIASACMRFFSEASYRDTVSTVCNTLSSGLSSGEYLHDLLALYSNNAALQMAPPPVATHDDPVMR